MRDFESIVLCCSSLMYVRCVCVLNIMMITLRPSRCESKILALFLFGFVHRLTSDTPFLQLRRWYEASRASSRIVSRLPPMMIIFANYLNELWILNMRQSRSERLQMKVQNNNNKYRLNDAERVIIKSSMSTFSRTIPIKELLMMTN